MRDLIKMKKMFETFAQEKSRVETHDDIKPIETHYLGYRFRSRLEARWAVFFQTLGVKFEYEPEGFDLGDGLKYLPDFRLRDVLIHHQAEFPLKELYVEVKGNLTPDDIKKIERFTKEPADSEGYIRKRPIYIVGDIPLDEWDLTAKYDKNVNFYSFYYVDLDNYTAFPTVENGRFCLLGGDYYVEGATEVMERAFEAARGARFEHGEKGYSRNEPREGRCND